MFEGCREADGAQEYFHEPMTQSFPIVAVACTRTWPMIFTSPKLAAMVPMHAEG